MGLFAKLISHYVEKDTWCNSCRRQTSRWSCTRLPMSSPSFPIAARCLSSWRYAFASARAQQQQVSLIFIDLDGFKAINDRFGHPCGDSFLVQVGNDSPLSRAGKISLAALAAMSFDRR